MCISQPDRHAEGLMTKAAKKEEDTQAGYLRFNLNLIVDRPDGLIKEGNKRSYYR